ncbi:hypothetical protein HJB81_24505 [Rhizobium sp. NZLR1]|nr:hypothetical protein [Rhizobium sp. NZLR3b]MBX5204514.1 hypothetical protein [Rhizobium sp. NZLR1]QSZ24731.1 carboxymuconolactone decarboxylase family protein [Rhizobium sp. NZLR1]
MRPRKVLGHEYVDRALGSADDFSRPFQDVLNEYCWGAAWTDNGLDLKQRSLVNLGMLAAFNRMHEFGIHVRGETPAGARATPRAGRTILHPTETSCRSSDKRRTGSDAPWMAACSSICQTLDDPSQQ